MARTAVKKKSGFDWSGFDLSQRPNLANAAFIKALRKLERSQAPKSPVRSVVMTIERWEWEAANLNSPYEP
jgi:hypothetical protein